MTNPLKTWLTDTDTTAAAFALRVGCSASHMFAVLNGTKRCGADLGFEIQDKTGGDVTCRDLREWYDASHAPKKDAA